MNDYDKNLEKNNANFVPLTPLSFLERAKDIYPNYEAADDERYKQSVKFVVLVNDSIRGLKVGAPVEYRGVHIGQVLSTNMLTKNAPTEIMKNELEIPVLIALQPGRVGLPDNKSGVERMAQQNKLWIRQGLKAMLRSGNLLTGSLFIDLQHYNKQPIDNVKTFAGFPVMPTVTNEFSQIANKAGEFIDNLNKLPLSGIANNTNELLLEVTEKAKKLQGVSQNLEQLLANANNEKLSQQLKLTLQGISSLTKDLSSGSTGYEDLRKALGALTGVMQELNPLLKQLKHQPNGLIFNSGQTETIEPKKYSGVKN